MKLVVFDLDGTLIDCEIIDELAKYTKNYEKVKEITEKAMKGEMDLKEAMYKRIELIRGVPYEKVIELANNLPLMKGAREVVKTLKDNGFITCIITGSFDIFANKIKEELGIDYVFANGLMFKNDVIDGFYGEIIDDKSKLMVLQKLLEKLNLKLKDVVVVGDGANDISIMERAGLSISFNGKGDVNLVADVIIREKDLTKILNYIFRRIDEDSLIKERDRLDNELKELRKNILSKKKILKQLDDEWKRLINQIRSVNRRANELRERRRELRKELKRLQNREIRLENEIHELESRYNELKPRLTGNVRKLQRAISALEWKLQTSVMSLRRESELVSKIENLRKKLEPYKELLEIENNLKKKRTQIEKVKGKIEEVNKEIETVTKELEESISKIREIEKKVEEINKEKIKILNELENLNKEYEEKKDKLESIKKELDAYKSSYEERIKKRKERREKVLAKRLYKRFLSGEKLGSDEILLLRRYNLI